MNILEISNMMIANARAARRLASERLNDTETAESDYPFYAQLYKDNERIIADQIHLQALIEEPTG